MSNLRLELTRQWSSSAGRSFGAVAALCAVVASILTAGMAIGVDNDTAAPAAGAVGVALVIFTLAAWRAAQTTTDASKLTLATTVTTVRSGAIVALAAFVVVSRPGGLAAWVPVALFAVGTGLDWLDGTIARVRDATTEFGARLDAEADGLALLIGPLVAIQHGTAPVFLLAVGLARYAFVGGIWLRRQRGQPVRSLPPRRSRRFLGAFAMISVAVLLTPLVASTLGEPIAVVLTMPFLLGFGRDWLLVTGRR